LSRRDNIVIIDLILYNIIAVFASFPKLVLMKTFFFVFIIIIVVIIYLYQAHDP